MRAALITKHGAAARSHDGRVRRRPTPGAAVRLRGLPGSLLSLALLLLSVGPAAAQGAESEDPSRDSEARALFEAGVSAYDGGRYEEALRYFQQSYALSRRPGLLHNIGSAAERARQDELALRSYEEYLRLEPDAANRPRVENRIAALRRLITQGSDRPAGAGAPDAATDGVRETPGGAGGDAGPLGWILIASGGAVAVAGGILLGVGLSDQATVEDPAQGARWADAEAAYDRGPTLLTSGTILLPVGLAALGVGVVLALLPSGEEGASEAGASLDLGPGSLILRGRF